jgi:hypothetical protein
MAHVVYAVSHPPHWCASLRALKGRAGEAGYACMAEILFSHARAQYEKDPRLETTGAGPATRFLAGEDTECDRRRRPAVSGEDVDQIDIG